MIEYQADRAVTLRIGINSGEVVVGLTAGASTPNVKIGETVEAIFATLGVVQ